MKNEGEGRRKGGWTGEEKVSYSCSIVIDFQKLKGSGTARCGSVGVGVVVLEEVCLVGTGFEGSYDAQPTPSETDHFPFACQMQGSQLLLQHRVCPHTATSHHDANGLNKHLICKRVTLIKCLALS